MMSCLLKCYFWRGHLLLIPHIYNLSKRHHFRPAARHTSRHYESSNRNIRQGAKSALYQKASSDDMCVQYSLLEEGHSKKKYIMPRYADAWANTPKVRFDAYDIDAFYTYILLLLYFCHIKYKYILLHIFVMRRFSSSFLYSAKAAVCYIIIRRVISKQQGCKRVAATSPSARCCCLFFFAFSLVTCSLRVPYYFC